MPFCPRCGKVVGKEDSFCRGCGRTLQPTVQETTSQAPTKLEVEQTQSILSKHIRPGEKVLWTGKPVKVPFIVPSLMAIPFGLIFMGMSAFMFMMTLGAPWIFQLFLLPFFLVGFFTSFGPLISQLMRYNNTEYMITDQRIITQTGAIGRDTRFVDLEKIQEVYVTVGFFDKMFGTGSVITSTAGNIYVGSGPFMRPSLSSLREPYEVQRLLQEAVKNARTSGNRL